MAAVFTHRASLTIIFVLMLIGCSSKTPAKVEPPLKEIPTTEGTVSDLSEEELIFRAKKFYESGLLGEAKENFASLKTSHPLGAYGEFAEIKSADALFDEGSYDAAAQAYEEFLKSRPAADSTPYIMYRAARSNQLAQRGLGRDMSSLEKAVTQYDQLMKQFPNSSYTFGAREMSEEAHRDLAAYQQQIVDFYKRQGKEAAANARNQRLTTTVEPQLVQMAKERESAAKADTTQLQSYGRTVESTPLKVVTIKQQDSGAVTASRINPETLSSLRVVRAECHAVPQATGTKYQAMLYLNKEFTDQSALRTYTGSKGHELKIHLPETLASASMIPCGTTGSLALSPSGDLSMRDVQSLTLTSLPNPPRLLAIATP